MDFNITAEEQRLPLVIVGHLDAGNAPTVDGLSADLGHDVHSAALSLRRKGWILVRDVNGRDTVVALAPMALQAVRSLRYGRRET
ncbi:hypothetical protein ACIHFE_02685 [Streptomyces sp. NPDC052396]|uniref:hypothetical protein n=1 Tax=Streptomyces sp. NPDC052396 TaxID=3365689 RepID=UPI0037D165E0